MTRPGADHAGLRERYAAERAKRIRPEGPDQYVSAAAAFPELLIDPYLPVTPRDPVTDHVTFTFVGGGFSGLLAGARLTEAGVPDVRIVDRAGDFGGTWYWNRYPGVMCDTASLVYLPLLEETGYLPSEKYAHGPEIREHCRRIGRHYHLYDKALLHTEVTDAEWDAGEHRWIVRTNRGDAFTTTFLAVGPGPFPVPKLPAIPDVHAFHGAMFHTSRWDYAYTGGDAEGAPMDRLADKRVALIGTGATGVQCVPELAKTCQQLLVFQRTPSSVDVRGNHRLDPEWFASIATPGWQQRWLENFTANWEGIRGGCEEIEDLVQDGWTDIARRMKAELSAVPPGELTPERFLQIYERTDDAKMEQIRHRVDTVVADPETAGKLKAWYRQLCKRPCFHDEYLDAFNCSNVQLVDTDGKGVSQITAAGVVACGQEYPVDCIIFASGFILQTDFLSRTGFDLRGRGGEKLSQHWAEGIRTLHGMHVHGFPNAFVVQLYQAGFLPSNVPHNYVEASKTLAGVVRHALDNGYREVEADQEAEEGWVALLTTNGRTISNGECTPGYYNNEGRAPGPKERMNAGYPQGAGAYFRLMDRWRNSGTFEGLTFR